MCLNPITICRPSETFKAAHGIKFLPSSPEAQRAFDLLKKGHPQATNALQYNIVPCGKCIECLKKRQNDLACRCEREAVLRGSMHFVTLTYEDAYLPFACRLQVLDVESGEIISQEPFKIVTRSEFGEDDLSFEFRDELISEFRSRVKSSEPIYINKLAFVSPVDECLEYYYQFTPTLNRRDLRLTLKRFRVYYKRQFGKVLPEFSYVACGEFGPRTCRPHYHLAFFGLTDEQVAFFVSLWQYGTQKNWKRVSARNEDGTNGFQIASKYVGKYLSKGKFECSSVKCKDAEKGSLCMSKGLGANLTYQMISYYRAYDIFGPYNPDTLVLSDNNRQKLTSEQIDNLFAVIEQRNCIEINNHKTALPLYLVRKIWYTYDKVKKSYRSFTLRALHSNVLRDRFIQGSQGEFESYISKFPSENLCEAVASFSTYIETSKQNREYMHSKNLFRFYSKSLL